MSFDNENISGIIFNTLDNGSIFLNGTSTDVIYRTIGNADLKANTDYVLSTDSNITEDIQIYFNGNPISSGTNWIPIGNNHTVFRVNEDIQDAQINITIKNSTTVNKVFKIQLEENSVLTEYEPYTGGQPSPSPDYPQEINSIEGSVEFACRGKNLLNIDFENINKPGISEKTEYPVYQIYINKGITFNNFTFKPQIEKGTKATSCEPYVEPNKVTFNLNDEKLRSVGDVKDELVVDLDTGDYFKVENIGEVVLNGSEEYTNNNLNSFTLLKDINIKRKELYERPEIMCNQYISSRNDEINEKDYAISQYIPTALYNYNKIVIHNIDYNNDVSLFKEYLSANNVIANYQLATPTTKKLGTLSAENLAKLKTFKGYNNVTVNTNLGLMNIRFTYGLDIKKYVDNKIAELSAQMIEEG